MKKNKKEEMELIKNLGRTVLQSINNIRRQPKPITAQQRIDILGVDENYHIELTVFVMQKHFIDNKGNKVVPVIEWDSEDIH
jgi:hypothetical protein